MAFKMKGSPMKRNFGIGASPVKQKVELHKREEEKVIRPETFKTLQEKLNSGSQQISSPDQLAEITRAGEKEMIEAAKNAEAHSPNISNYPMEGPQDVSDVYMDDAGILYFIDLNEGTRFNVPEGAADYKGIIEEGDDIDETWLEELFGMDKLSDEPVEINPPK